MGDDEMWLCSVVHGRGRSLAWWLVQTSTHFVATGADHFNTKPCRCLIHLWKLLKPPEYTPLDPCCLYQPKAVFAWRHADVDGGSFQANTLPCASADCVCLGMNIRFVCFNIVQCRVHTHSKDFPVLHDASAHMPAIAVRVSRKCKHEVKVILVFGEVFVIVPTICFEFIRCHHGLVGAARLIVTLHCYQN